MNVTADPIQGKELQAIRGSGQLAGQAVSPLESWDSPSKKYPRNDRHLRVNANAESTACIWETALTTRVQRKIPKRLLVRALSAPSGGSGFGESRADGEVCEHFRTGLLKPSIKQIRNGSRQYFDVQPGPEYGEDSKGLDG